MFMALGTFAENLTVNDTSVEGGTSVVLNIALNNTGTNYVGFQFDITLPNGLMVDKSSSSLGERVSSSASFTIGNNDSTCRVVCADLGMGTINGKSGTIFKLALIADTSFAGGKARFTNIQLVDKDSKVTTLYDTSCKIAAKARHAYAKDSLYVDSVFINYGDSAVNLEINLKKETKNLTLFDFALKLPKGFSVKSNRFGRPMATFNQERSSAGDHTVTSNKVSEGYYKFLVSSNQLSEIIGADGLIMTIPLLIDKSVRPGAYTANLDEIWLSNIDGESFRGHECEISIISVGDSLYVDSVPTIARHDVVANLQIKLKLQSPNITALEFDVDLPSGFSLEMNSSGKLLATFNQERSVDGDHVVTAKLKSEGLYTVYVSSGSSSNIKGEDGLVMTLPLAVSSKVKPDTYKGKLENFSVINTGGKKYKGLTSSSFSIVRENPIMGDVNEDGLINAADISTLKNFVVGATIDGPFDQDAADMNQDGSILGGDVVLLIKLLLND